MSFDTEAKTWDADPKKVERAQVLAHKIADFAVGKELHRALEFGCGTGLLSFFLKDVFADITLADTSPGMIEVLQDKIAAAGVSHFTPVLMDENAGFKSQAFDITYSLLTLHHISDLNSAFVQFENVLKDGGFLCIADLVKEEGDFHNAEASKHLHHGFDKEDLIQRLQQVGFSFVDYQEFYVIEKTTEEGVLKNYPLFMLIMQKNKEKEAD